MKVAYWIIVVIVTVSLLAAGGGAAGLGVVVFVAAVAVFKVTQRLNASSARPPLPQPYATAPVPKPPSATTTRQTEHVPPAPAGIALAPWSPTTQLFEVAGEYFRMVDFADLFAGLPTDSPGGYELQKPAHLVPDPSSRQFRHSPTTNWGKCPTPVTYRQATWRRPSRRCVRSWPLSCRSPMGSICVVGSVYASSSSAAVVAATPLRTPQMAHSHQCGPYSIDPPARTTPVAALACTARSPAMRLT